MKKKVISSQQVQSLHRQVYVKTARESITEQNAHNNEDMFVDENACVNTNINLKEVDFTKIVKNSLYTYKEVLNDCKSKFREVKMSEYYKDACWKRILDHIT